MAKWIQFNPAELFPQEISRILESIQALVDILNPLITAASSLLEVVAGSMINAQNAQEIAVQAAYDAIELLINSIIQALTQTGVYKLTYFTPSFSHYITPAQWLSSVGESLFDKADERRPILIDPDAEVGAIIVLATADNLKTLMENFNSFFSLLQGLVASLSQIATWPSYPEEFQVIGGVGKEPNWSSIKIADIIPGLNQICDMIIGMINNLLPPSSSSDLLNAAILILADKIAKLQAFLTKIANVIQIINTIMTFEGVFLLPVRGTGDAAWLSGEWTGSTGGPLEVPNATYTVGGVFLVTGGTDADTLFSFFGL